MAGLNLHPPEPFDFSKPDTWLKWKRRFEQFCDTSRLTGEADTRQISTLLYTMDENADNVLTSTQITMGDRAKYSKMMEKFDELFKVRRNVIFECTKFNRRHQHSSESVEQFITELYFLVEMCNYGELSDDMVRDQIVVEFGMQHCLSDCRWTLNLP